RVVDQQLRVLDRGPVAFGAVGVADVPDRLAVGLGLRFAGQQAALVVAVRVDHRRGAAAAVGGGDRLRQAIGGVAPALVPVQVRERQRLDPVAGVIGAHGLAVEDLGGVALLVAGG